MQDSTVLWIVFNAFILGMLVLDLGVFHRKAHQVSVKEALIWTGVWISLAFLFNVFIYYKLGEASAYEFFTGYLIEKSLSIDNIFVFIMIFSYFNVPASSQHKVLFWGVLGALVMRAIFIYLGVELIHKFHWIIYIFGSFLIYSGVNFMLQKEVKVNPDTNFFVKLTRMVLPVTPEFHGSHFVVRVDKRLWATPLLLVVVLIEATDLIFAVDSIPAILAISEDPFIVYSSNVFAILGLRSLYFALAGIEKYFIYLKYGMGLILIFVGIKMCIADFLKIPIEISLAFIVLVLLFSVLASILLPAKKPESTPEKKETVDL